VNEVRLISLRIDEASRISSLMPDYLAEMGNYVEVPKDGEGEMTYPYLTHYWKEPDRFPILWVTEDTDGGFALVRRMIDPDSGDAYHCLAEFFVTQPFRRRGLGAMVAAKVLNSFGGQWEVSVLKTNLPAQKFWQRTLTQICPDLSCNDVGASFSYELKL
jgi:predicted acetyltransferase